MKKFTLLLASAAVASTAMAAQPQQVVKNDLVVAGQMQQMEQATVSNQRVEMAPIATMNRGVELTEDFEDVDVRFRRPTQALYNGLTVNLNYYSQLCGIVGVHGYLQFANYSTGCDSYEWQWNNYMREPYDESYTSAVNDLELGNRSWPMSFVSAPVLLGKGSDGSEGSFELDSVACYRFGGNLAGMLQDYDAVGLTRCSTVGGGGLIGYMAVDKTGTDESFDANGVFVDWATTIAQINKLDESSVTNVVINGFSSTLPWPSSPYLMSKMWIWVNGSVSEDTELTATIYEIGADGYVTDKVVGKATCVVNKGDLGVLTYDILPVDEDGFEIYEPFVANTGLYITFNLSDNEAITRFLPVFNKGNVLPAGAQRNEYYPATAFINLSYDEDGVTQDVMYQCPYNYYNGDSRSEVWSPSDMFVMYDISFPYVSRADDTFGDFNVLLPEATAATATIDVTGLYFNFKELINNNSMTAETEDDWFEFTVGDANEETYLTTITVEAEALPAGVASRTGSIVFTGMGQDFTVNVYQGEIAAGLGSISVAKEGVEYFDIQGRKLQSAPATGLFIERAGDKVTKVIR